MMRMQPTPATPPALSRQARLVAIAIGLGLMALLGLSIARLHAAPTVVYDHPLHVTNRPVSAAPAAGESADATGGQPRLEIPVTFHDFGSIGATQVVRQDFLLTNRGSVPLRIRSAYTTCGCTTAEFSASVIPPGKAARITLTYDAGYHHAAGNTVRRGLVIRSNDPHQGQVEIWIQATLR
ncbi:MAG: DUF1573 domain-containing protein [Chloroflexi bacterium]|nr:DUF1573 domain-containing protein [Chloroflexota bacterium]